MLKLNGNWDYILDSDSKLNIDQIKQRVKRKKFDGNINVPSNWNSETFTDYSGTLWYITKFDLITVSNWKSLNFSGIDYYAEAWFNGLYLGKHEGYFQLFSFIINKSELLKKSNILIVKVTSPIEDTKNKWPDRKQLIKGIFNHHDCRPGGWSKKYGQEKNTGGIWNDVFISDEKEVIINCVKVESKLTKTFAESKITIKYTSKLQGQTESYTKFVCRSSKGKTHSLKLPIRFEPNCGEVSILIKIENPDLWYPWEMCTPVMYNLKISCELFNDYKTSFGIREVKLSDKQEFFINGKRLFLRGTNIIPEQFLCKINRTRINQLIKNLKDANVNIVRIHAHVNRKELYEEFDKNGILVWQDFALQWTYDESSEFRINACSQIKDMVKQFYNHPSIVVWCCHNEPGYQIETLDPYLFDSVKEEDLSRIVRQASNYEEHPYEGWYWGSMEHYISKPMGPMVTEFGAQAIPELKSLIKILSKDDITQLNWANWEYHNFQYEQTFNVAKVVLGKDINSFINNSQEYQAALIKKAIHFYRRNKWQGTTGIFQFMFVDCWESISWSVLDYFGEKKKGYYSLKKSFDPLLISVELKKAQYQVSAELFMELWIINDLHIQYKGLKLSVMLNDKELKKIDGINAFDDSVLHYSDNHFKIKLPEKSFDGKIEFKLTDANTKLIAEASENIKILDTTVGWDRI